MVKEGYKETDIGIIPEDWDIKFLSEIGSFKKGKGIKKDEVTDTGLQCIRYGQIYTDYDHAVYVTKSFINESTALNSVRIKYGDLVLAGSGETLEDIGKAIVYLGEKECYVGGDTIIMTPNDLINSLYLSYFLSANVVSNQKRKLGQGNSIVHLYVDGAKQIKAVIPPSLEQNRIAEILSTTDAHIEKLDKIIEDYQLLKKGMMKKLLTEGIGHTEFKETEIGRIPKTWKVMPIFNTGQYINGKAFKPSDWESKGVPIIRIQNLCNPNAEFNYCNSEIENKYWVEKGEILFSWSATLAIFKWAGEKAYLNQHIYKVIPRDNIEASYLYYQLSFAVARMAELAHGSTMKHITKSNLESFYVAIPTTREEQMQIASILSAIDARLESLKRIHEEFIQLKKSLMDKLLTGKIRTTKIKS